MAVLEVHLYLLIKILADCCLLTVKQSLLIEKFTNQNVFIKKVHQNIQTHKSGPCIVQPILFLKRHEHMCVH